MERSRNARLKQRGIIPFCSLASLCVAGEDDIPPARAFYAKILLPAGISQTTVVGCVNREQECRHAYSSTSTSTVPGTSEHQRTSMSHLVPVQYGTGREHHRVRKTQTQKCVRVIRLKVWTRGPLLRTSTI